MRLKDEGIWKKAFVVCLKALPQHCVGESGEKHGIAFKLSEQECKGCRGDNLVFIIIGSDLRI